MTRETRILRMDSQEVAIDTPAEIIQKTIKGALEGGKIVT